MTDFPLVGLEQAYIRPRRVLCSVSHHVSMPQGQHVLFLNHPFASSFPLAACS